MNIRTRLYTAIYCISGTIGLCALWTSAGATDEVVPTKTVRFNDLNITSEAGAKVLYGRIRAAARDVCELSASGDPIMRPAVSSCIQKAIDKAVKDVNAPMLTYLRFGSSDVRLASK